MLGAIAGDIIGSVYEHNNTKSTDFPLFVPRSTFTDGTVLTIALADSILNQAPFVEKLKEYYRLYPHAGYGGFFHHWARSSDTRPYNSFGNGSAMRVSPVGFAYPDLETVLNEAERSAAVTHNHPEGIKGAQAAASAIYLARTGCSKQEIKDYVEKTFHYNLSRPFKEIWQTYQYNETCQGTVPEAITAFLVSEDFEDALRKGISLGGDSDTLACITGGIAEAYYGGVPDAISRKIYEILDPYLASIVHAFTARYPSSKTQAPV
jgi:ADP-ribosylglycohydrolase